MTRILLYSEEPVLARGLQSILTRDEGFELTTTASGLSALREQLAASAPDILLLDMTPEMTMGALAELKRAAVRANILLWVTSISTELAFQAIGLGVRGIVRKALPVEALLRCMRKVQAGELWLEKELTDSFLSARRFTLTQREGQLVNLLSQGMKNKEIATALMISEGTVKVYLSRLFQKVGVKDRFELALFGLKNLRTAEGAGEKLHGKDSAPVPSLRSLVLDRGGAPAAIPPFATIRREYPLRVS